MISARTKAALAASRKKLGGDRGNRLKIATQARKGHRASLQARQEAAAKRSADLLPIIEAIKAEGAVSLRQIAAALNERGIPTARGGEWSAVQVQRILRA